MGIWCDDTICLQHFQCLTLFLMIHPPSTPSGYLIISVALRRTSSLVCLTASHLLSILSCMVSLSRCLRCLKLHCHCKPSNSTIMCDSKNQVIVLRHSRELYVIVILWDPPSLGMTNPSKMLLPQILYQKTFAILISDTYERYLLILREVNKRVRIVLR